MVTKHHDVKEVSRNSELFSSRENTAIIRFRDGMPRDNIEVQRLLLLNMDPPMHTKLRGIISRGFTPRAINSLREALELAGGADRRGGDGQGQRVTSSRTSRASCRCRRSRS